MFSSGSLHVFSPGLCYHQWSFGPWMHWILGWMVGFTLPCASLHVGSILCHLDTEGWSAGHRGWSADQPPVLRGGRPASQMAGWPIRWPAGHVPWPGGQLSEPTTLSNNVCHCPVLSLSTGTRNCSLAFRGPRHQIISKIDTVA